MLCALFKKKKNLQEPDMLWIYFWHYAFCNVRKMSSINWCECLDMPSPSHNELRIVIQDQYSISEQSTSTDPIFPLDDISALKRNKSQEVLQSNGAPSILMFAFKSGERWCGRWVNNQNHFWCTAASGWQRLPHNIRTITNHHKTSEVYGDFQSWGCSSEHLKLSEKQFIQG